MFSFLPGAGHMFMGFMKLGSSLMALFFLIAFLSSWLNFGVLMLFSPVLWFYSFFDCICKCWANDDEFAKFEDHFLISADKFSAVNIIFKGKSKLIIGILILLIGIYLIFEVSLRTLQMFIPYTIFNLISSAASLLPRFVVGAAIIAIGVYLIIGKRRSNDSNA
jgi:hypothetical protein